MQPLEKRIFRTLQQAKAEGIEELGLLGEDIKDSYARKIMSKLNKYLGKGSVYRELGVWYLLPEYWEMSAVEFRDLVILNEIKSVKRFGYSLVTIILLLTTILAVLLTLIIIA